MNPDEISRIQFDSFGGNSQTTFLTASDVKLAKDIYTGATPFQVNALTAKNLNIKNEASANSIHTNKTHSVRDAIHAGKWKVLTTKRGGNRSLHFTNTESNAHVVVNPSSHALIYRDAIYQRYWTPPLTTSTIEALDSKRDVYVMASTADNKRLTLSRQGTPKNITAKEGDTFLIPEDAHIISAKYGYGQHWARGVKNKVAKYVGKRFPPGGKKYNAIFGDPYPSKQKSLIIDYIDNMRPAFVPYTDADLSKTLNALKLTVV